MLTRVESLTRPVETVPITTSCDVCGRQAVYIWSYLEERGEMLPSDLQAEESDGVPPEKCCHSCTRRRHGVDFSPLTMGPEN